MLLRYLPLKAKDREEHLIRQRQTYRDFMVRQTGVHVILTNCPCSSPYFCVQADWLNPAPPVEEHKPIKEMKPAEDVPTTPILSSLSPLPSEMNLTDFIGLPTSASSSSSDSPVKKTPSKKVDVTAGWAKSTEEEARDAIDKDVHRTYPMLHFFRGPNLDVSVLPLLLSFIRIM